MNIFFLRSEYREYMEECQQSGIAPAPFRQWHDTAYYYDMLDNQD